MMRPLIIASLIALALAPAANADWTCQVDAGPWMTWRSALEDVKTFGTAGLSAGVAAQRNAHWRFRFGVSHRRGNGGAIPPTFTAKMPCRQRQSSLSFDAIHPFASEHGMSPFVGVGLSINSLRLDFDAVDVTPSRFRTDQVVPSLLVGIEPRLYREARLVARTELGYVLTNSYDFPADYARRRLQLSVGVGISIPLFRSAPSPSRPVAANFAAPPLPEPSYRLEPVPVLIDTTAPVVVLHDHDRDQDGVSDSLDHCPGTPHGMDVDSSGCLAMTQLDKRVVVVVDYRKGSIALDDTARLILNDLAVRLKAALDLHATIEGFTDDVGDSTANRRLSQRRANAAKEYLVARGIAPKRLEAIGRGATLFIADNATDLGRKRNRRLEISFQ